MMESPDVSKIPIHMAEKGDAAPSGVIAGDTAEQPPYDAIGMYSEPIMPCFRSMLWAIFI
jgi:hypothetical protein